ncbi:MULTISPECIES: cysteine-rich small domain-containing protein [unclassified Butyrivibrio]|uniref:cysteine-rich small domain-containing protein n=1 Tax=unclassified Butyrivibrio TaxID=2639466 RepID=UPI0004790C42
MKNSSRFFANKECEYYPCHESENDINCLFCYCPLYNLKCPGNFKIVDKGDRKIKSCINCTFPHEPDNYDAVVSLLKNKGEK